MKWTQFGIILLLNFFLIYTFNQVVDCKVFPGIHLKWNWLGFIPLLLVFILINFLLIKKYLIHGFRFNEWGDDSIALIIIFYILLATAGIIWGVVG